MVYLWLMDVLAMHVNIIGVGKHLDNSNEDFEDEELKCATGAPCNVFS